VQIPAWFCFSPESPSHGGSAWSCSRERIVSHASSCHQTHKKREVIDITQKLEAVLWKQYEDKTESASSVFCIPLRPDHRRPRSGTDLDMLDAFELMVRSSTTGTSTIRSMYPITFCRR